MKRRVIVLLVAFGVGVAFGATNEVDFSTYPSHLGFGYDRLSDARVILQRFREEYDCDVVSAAGTNHEWKVGSGKAVWVLTDGFVRGRWSAGSHYLKFDAEGRLVATGGRFFATSEFKAVRERCLVEAQGKWATEHGMTLEEAQHGSWKYSVESRKRMETSMKRTRKAQSEQIEKLTSLLGDLDDLENARRMEACRARVVSSNSNSFS